MSNVFSDASPCVASFCCQLWTFRSLDAEEPDHEGAEDLDSVCVETFLGSCDQLHARPKRPHLLVKALSEPAKKVQLGSVAADLVASRGSGQGELAAENKEFR